MSVANKGAPQSRAPARHATARRGRTSGTTTLHQSHTIKVPPSGELRIAVISDTHSKAHDNSLTLVGDQEPDLVLHAGDIGELGVLEPFAELAPFFVVRGNIDARSGDWHGAPLPDSVDLCFERDGHPVLRVLLMHIAVYGPKLRADARRLAQTHQCTLVVCGHSHVPFMGSDRGVSMFNPGSIGPRRFGLPITFGVLDLDDKRLQARHMSCETGKTWLP